MPRTGYRTKRGQKKIVDDPHADEREARDDEYECEVLRQPRGGNKRERGGHCARREMGRSDIVLRRPRDAAGYPRGRKKGGKKKRWGDCNMGRESGLYISEKEQLTNIHICLNVRQNVCALDEQNEGDLTHQSSFIFKLRCRTSLPD